MLVRLLYASRAAAALTPETIEAILATSRKRNPPEGITGLLCSSGDNFMQVLEGGREAVNHLYARICQDARHRDVILLHYEEITERRFAAWPDTLCGSSTGRSEYFSRIEGLTRLRLTWPMVQAAKRRSVISS